MKKLDLILYTVIGILIAVILSGALWGVRNKKTEKSSSQTENELISLDSPKKGTEKGISPLQKKANTKSSTYSEIGQIRAVTKAEENSETGTGIPVVVTPVLSYPEGDSVFFEELSGKRLVIKDIFRVYFSSRTRAELISKTEDQIKKEILEEINSELNLGKILDIFFNDYIFLQ